VSAFKKNQVTKTVNGTVTGFYYYGNGIVLRVGQKVKLYIPQSFLSQKPSDFLALKVKANAVLDKYYGGKFKTLYVVKKPSDFTVEENFSLETDPQKRIEVLFKALGKTAVYKKLFLTPSKRRKKDATLKALAKTYNPDFIFKLVNKKHVDFLGGLAFFYLLHGTDEKIPFSGYAEALSWTFWTLYKEEKTSKVNLEKAFQVIRNTLGLVPPDLKNFIKYLFYKSKFYFYVPREELNDGSSNQENNSVEGKELVETVKEMLKSENAEEIAKKLHYYDWKYKVMKEKTEEFFEKAFSANDEFKASELFDENREVNFEKLYYFVLNNPVTVISGPPGAGKSTIVKNLSTLFERAGLKVCRAAPTGFASLNVKGITVARAFDVFNHDKKKPPALEADVIFVDETSQVPLDVLYTIIKKVTPQQKLVFSGDPNQLSPVEGENVFELLVEKAREKDKLVELKKVYRFLPEKKTVIYLLPSSQDVIYATAYIYLHYAVLRGENTLVMTPYHRNFTGTKKLNLLIKTLIDLFSSSKRNPYKTFKPSVINAVKKVVFTKNVNNDSFIEKGAKVIVTKNVYDANDQLVCVNKDVGIIEEVDEQGDEVYVRIERNGTIVKIPKKDVYPAYSLEFFASQGQESDCSVVIIPKGYVERVSSDENLKKALYTTATRARKYTFFLTTQDNYPAQLELLLKSLNVKVESVKVVTKKEVLEKLKKLEKVLFSKPRQTDSSKTVPLNSLNDDRSSSFNEKTYAPGKTPRGVRMVVS